MKEITYEEALVRMSKGETVMRGKDHVPPIEFRWRGFGFRPEGRAPGGNWNESISGHEDHRSNGWKWFVPTPRWEGECVVDTRDSAPVCGHPYFICYVIQPSEGEKLPTGKCRVTIEGVEG